MNNAREVHVRVTTDARKELMSVHDDHFDIQVKEPAQDNRANARVVQLIARHLGVIESHVHIVRGHHRPKKVVRIADAH